MSRITHLIIKHLFYSHHYSLLILFIFLWIPNTAIGSDEYIKHKTKGMLVGTAFSTQKLDGGIHYLPIQFIYKFNTPLFHNHQAKRSNLFLHLEPQFNLVVMGSDLKAFETGVNLGLTYNYLFAKKWIVFLGLGAGPHYISIETSRLAKGFTFSDNFMFGIRKSLKIKNSKYELEFQTRFRHMSNAGLKQPTAGIESFLFLFGFSKLF